MGGDIKCVRLTAQTLSKAMWRFQIPFPTHPTFAAVLHYCHYSLCSCTTSNKYHMRKNVHVWLEAGVAVAVAAVWCVCVCW